MASTVLVKDALWRVSVLLQDTSPQFQRQPEGELVDWWNDGQVAITKYLPAACSRVDAIKLAPGTRQSIERILAANCKPGDGSTPDTPILGTQLLDLICNMGANGTTPGRSIRPVDRRILDSQTPTWHTITGTAVASYTHDPRTPRYFFVTPAVPASPAVWVMASFTAQPIMIPNTGTPGAPAYAKDGGSTTTISIADEFLDDLVNYVMARAHMKEVEWADKAVAQAYTTLFTGSLNAKIEALTGNNPNLKRLPLAPAPLGAAS